MYPHDIKTKGAEIDMLKRIAAVLLLLAMAFSIVSCKDEQNEIDLAPLQKLMETTYEEAEYTPSSYKRYTDACSRSNYVYHQ